MKKSLFVAAFAGTVALFGSLPAVADVRDFKFVNDTNLTVIAMWVSTVDDNRWRVVRNFGDVDPGNTAKIHFDDTGPCRVPMRIELDDGSKPQWYRGFDLFTVRAIKIWYDRSNDTYQATYE